MERTPGTGPSLCASGKPEKMQMGAESYKEFGIAAAEGVHAGGDEAREKRSPTPRRPARLHHRGACPPGQMCTREGHYSSPPEVGRISQEVDAVVQERDNGGPKQGEYDSIGMRGQSQA